MNLPASLVSDISPDAEAKHKLDGDSLAQLRHLLSSERRSIKQNFESQKLSGIEAAHALSRLTDDIIQRLAKHAGCTLLEHQNTLCICAIGGYSSELLAPFSDIDLLFLTEDKPSAVLKEKIDYILYNLWALGLRVEHATRSIKESLHHAQNDITICTSLLDIRPLSGNENFVKTLQEKLAHYLRKNGLETFLHRLISERRERHHHFGDTPYVVEPHLKEGRGGLRDIQSLNWMGRAAFHSSCPLSSQYHKFDFTQASLNLGLISEKEAYRTKKIWNFLWAVRLHLHYITNRPEERLTFDIQPILGARMGYTYHRKQRAVERFMRHYFLICRSVMRITHILQPAILINATHQKQQSTSLIEEGPSIFQRIDGRLDIKEPSLFASEPITLFRFLDTARAYQLKLSPSVKQQLIRHERYYSTVRGNKEASQYFLSLLCEPLFDKENPTKERRFWLPILNEIGLLPRYFHPWSRILGLTQFDSYHVYTVDEHTIEAVRIVRQIEAGRMADELPLAYKLAQTTQSRQVLYIATLFHKIGKGSQGNHCEVGAEIAETLCQKLHLCADKRDTICWLIAHHLLLSQTAFTRDIDDPQTIFDLADTIQSPERLKLLLLLTIADIRAVNPHAWTPWRATLLHRLYCRIADVLEGGLQTKEDDIRVYDTKQALQSLLKKDFSEATIHQFFSLASPAYWLGFDTQTHLKHAALLHDFFNVNSETISQKESSYQARIIKKNDFAILLNTFPQRGISELTILCPDKDGLFSLITGTLTAHNASISDARIHTLQNNLALDNFWIQNHHGEAFQEKADIDHLIEGLINALSSKDAPNLKAPLRIIPNYPPSHLESLHIPSRVMIDNHSSQHATIIEINGRDHPALLYKITQFFNKKDIIIRSAHITTYGLRAVDVFYLHNKEGEKITSQEMLFLIHQELPKMLTP